MGHTWKSRRFRFAFGLRTFLLVIAAFAVWLGWNTAIVRQRTAMRDQIRHSGGYVILDNAVEGPLDEQGREIIGSQAFDFSGGDSQIHFVRRLLGDERVLLIQVTDKSRLDEIKRVFPESVVVVYDLPIPFPGDITVPAPQEAIEAFGRAP